MIQQLQKFFSDINSVTWKNAYDLVSLYSTASVLSATGLNQKSVKAIKCAIRAKMVGLVKEMPEFTKSVAKSLQSLIENDEDFSYGQRDTSGL